MSDPPRMLVDCSGSMGSVQADAQGGINELLTRQFGLPGKFTVTLVEYVLEPRGMTRRLDAAGIEIKRTGADLAALDEAERPGRVAFDVVADGQENSSTEYRFEQVRALVEEQTTVYRWAFQFIGADDE